jgi:hypothetical protein
MSWYLTLRSDEQYSSFVDTGQVTSFLLSAFPSLQQTKPQVIASQPNTPWLEIHLAHCDSRGNYGFHDSISHNQINCIELICSTQEQPSYYYELAQKIADLLGWYIQDDNTWENPPIPENV